MTERMIRCRPGPSDAELEAERNAKHQREVDEWFAEQEPDHIPASEVIG